MSKQINKKGFTLAEALIAMMLVAVMAAGIITALMATKRAIVSPSNREEMMLAIEKASSLLQGDQAICNISASDKLALTPNCNLDSPNALDCHNINCLLPRSCATTGDYFVYTISNVGNDTEQKFINFKIKCDGETI